MPLDREQSGLARGHALFGQFSEGVKQPIDARGVGGGGGGNGPNAFRLLTWWQGGLVLLAGGVGPLVLGYFTTFRRDVT